VTINSKIKEFIGAVFILLASLFTVSCRNPDSSGSQLSYNTGKSSVQLAERFSLVRTDSCTILTITDPWQGASGIKNVYYLVDSNSKFSSSIDGNKVIRVPVGKIICMSTTHVAMIAALGKTDAIAGVSGTGFIFNREISERIEKGIIHDVGYDAGLNNELIISLSPDLIMIYGIGSESAGYLSKLRELGIRVMFNADYLESDPLAKAEWIKLFGALFCKEEMADSIYQSISEQYINTRQYISQNCDEKPVVLLGLPFRDTWFISPGSSYAGRFISDAGGQYLWHDIPSSEALPYSIENVYIRSLKADYWLNTGSARSKSEIVSLDPRLGKIPCFITGNVYNNNKRVSSEGGNDYWESGILLPHLILKDIAAILHPGLFPDYDLYYYKQLR